MALSVADDVFHIHLPPDDSVSHGFLEGLRRSDADEAGKLDAALRSTR